MILCLLMKYNEGVKDAEKQLIQFIKSEIPSWNSVFHQNSVVVALTHAFEKLGCEENDDSSSDDEADDSSSDDEAAEKRKDKEHLSTIVAGLSHYVRGAVKFSGFI